MGTKIRFGLQALSLRGKVRVILGSILAVVMAGAISVFLIVQVITRSYQTNIGSYQRLQTEMATMRVQMLEMTRTEKDFFISKDELYVDLMDESLENFETAFAAVAEQKQSVISADSLDIVKSSIASYGAAFKEAVKVTLTEVEKAEAAIALGRKLNQMAEGLEGGDEAEEGESEVRRLLMQLESEGSLFLASQSGGYISKAVSTNKKLQAIKPSKVAADYVQALRARGELLAKTQESADAISLFILKGEEVILESIKLLKAEAAQETARIDKIVALSKIGLVAGSILVMLVTVGALVFFSRLSVSMAKISNKIRLSSHETFTSSDTLKSASKKVSKAANEQASAIQETVATLNEIAAMVNKSVDNAKSSTDKATLSHEIANEGRQSVNEMRQAMGDIESAIRKMMTQVDDSNEQIQHIVKIIEEIASKTAVINDIVFQTKLLSFNASVEAARAGDQGKGFAVVAEEVGNLAQMSGNAAKEISELLDRSSVRVEEIVRRSKDEVGRLVKEGSEKVATGVTIADRCDEILGEVVGHVSNVKELMTEISHASKEQAEGVHNISMAMNELDEATHSNSDMADETSRCSLELASQSTDLSRAVELLDSEVFGLNHKRHQAGEEGKRPHGTAEDTEGAGSKPSAKGADVHQIHRTEVAPPPNLQKTAVGFEQAPSSDNPNFSDDEED